MCQSQAVFMIQILYEDYRKLIGHTMPKCSKLEGGMRILSKRIDFNDKFISRVND